MTTLNANDLVIPRGGGEKTASDMKIIFRNSKLAGHFSIMEGEVRPGELLAFHTHANEDQHMYIINGELHFEVSAGPPIGNGGIGVVYRCAEPRG